MKDIVARLLRVEALQGGQYRAGCPFCDSDAFFFGEQGYSCNNCGKLGSAGGLRAHLEKASAPDVVSILSPEFLDEFRRQQLLPINATPTPFAGWNAVCKDDGGQVGLAKGWFIVIGGNPKYGKSLLALNMARIAMENGEVVGFITLEMMARQLAVRFYAMATGFDVTELEKSHFTDVNFDRMLAELDPRAVMLRGADFFVNTTPLTQLAEVLAAMEGMTQQSPPVKFFIVDYLQLVGLGDEESINRQVSEVTTHLRHFALSKQVTVIALSQFNRQTSKEYSQPPRAQGLHGGMIVEASADQVLLLDHSRYAKDEDRPHIAMTYLIADLNRHGPSGAIAVEWNYRTLRIREANPMEEEEHWPK